MGSDWSPSPLGVALLSLSLGEVLSNLGKT